MFVIFGITATILACNSGNGDADKTADTSAATTDAAQAPAANQYERGLELIGSNDCTTCHAISEKKTGPAYTEVAKKYENTDAVKKDLVSKIINGGTGNWGNIPMTGHPALSEADALEMVNYIMSLKNR